jgi:hypothetical protein
VDGSEERALRRLYWFGIAILVWNIFAAIVAVAANWPSQFGRVGTDARADVLATGTAISAPALPLAILIFSLLLIRARNRWAWIGVVAFIIVALLFVIGGVGELLAPATPDTPKPVLVFGGLSALVIASVMLILVVVALKERGRVETSRSN